MKSIILTAMFCLLAQNSFADSSCVDTAISLNKMLKEKIAEGKMLQTKKTSLVELDKLIDSTSLIVDVYAKNLNICTLEEKSEVYRRLNSADAVHVL